MKSKTLLMAASPSASSTLGTTGSRAGIRRQSTQGSTVLRVTHLAQVLSVSSDKGSHAVRRTSSALCLLAEELSDGKVEPLRFAPWSLVPAVVGQLECACPQEASELQGRARRHNVISKAYDDEGLRLNLRRSLLHRTIERCSDIVWYSPGFADTSEKAHIGSGGVSWESGEGFRRSSNGRQWR